MNYIRRRINSLDAIALLSWCDHIALRAHFKEISPAASLRREDCKPAQRRETDIPAMSQRPRDCFCKALIMVTPRVVDERASMLSATANTSIAGANVPAGLPTVPPVRHCNRARGPFRGVFSKKAEPLLDRALTSPPNGCLESRGGSRHVRSGLHLTIGRSEPDLIANTLAIPHLDSHAGSGSRAIRKHDGASKPRPAAV